MRGLVADSGMAFGASVMGMGGHNVGAGLAPSQGNRKGCPNVDGHKGRPYER